MNYRNTFGEQVSYYFLWTSHLLKWLIFLTLFTYLFYYIPQLDNFKTNIYSFTQKTLDKIYTYGFVIWSSYHFDKVSFYVRNWKANEKKHAKQWGVSDYFLVERDREKFKCDTFKRIHSVTIPIQSTFKIICRYTLSFVVTLAMVSEIMIIRFY
jgi:hypothetical protein